MYKAAYNTSDERIQQLCSHHLKNGTIQYPCRIVYQGRNKVVACTLGNSEYNIKIFRKPGLFKGIIYGWFRASKARRSYEHSLRLLQLGIGTPEPYAYVEIHSLLHTLGRSYYISEQLGDEWHEIRYMEQRPDYPAMVEALSRWVACVHAKGVLVRDLSPGNILFRIIDGGYEFCMVDVNRMAFGCADRRLQLHRAGWLMNSEASSADFARHYAAASGMDAAEAEHIVLASYRRLQRRAARKRSQKAEKP